MLKFNGIGDTKKFHSFDNLNTSYVKVQQFLQFDKYPCIMYLNTSYVKVQRIFKIYYHKKTKDLNTSYVKVQHYITLYNQPSAYKFKYILC